MPETLIPELEDPEARKALTEAVLVLFDRWNVTERQRALLERFGLPTHGPRLDTDSVLAAIALDKKVTAGSVRWVLLEDVGRAVIRSDVPQEVVRAAVEETLS